MLDRVVLLLKDYILLNCLLFHYLLFVLQLVVANVLDTRKKEVILVTKDKEELLALSDEEEHRGMEIEEKLTRKIADLHLDFYSNSAIETKTSH